MPLCSCLWREYKYSNTKMIPINIKQNYILPHLIQFNEQYCSSLLFEMTFRSSRSQMFFKIGVLKIFAIFTGKHPCWNNSIKKRLQLRVFSMNIAKNFKTAFFIEHLHWLFLDNYITFYYLLLVMFTNSYKIICVFTSVLSIQITNIQKKKMKHL